PALPGAMSSGWHLHQSLVERGGSRNAFMSEREEQALSAAGMAFVAGLLKYARESCIFAVPTINGYKRFRPFSLAPNNIVWGRDNRGAMLRLIGGADDPASHVENRIGEPAANPYLYFVSQIVSGLAGIEQGLDPGPAVDTPYAAGAQLLPRSLVEAVGALRGSELFAQQLGRRFIDYFLTIKEFELHRFLSDEVTDWEQREYFDVF
ncbi:MAG: glutamine synthetase, partial [Solimonas sp.]